MRRLHFGSWLSRPSAQTITAVADCFTPAKRSWVMSRIRSSDTWPELQVRKALHAEGFRFRLARADLPGKPDIVLPRYRTAIFVHGCFWHGHNCKDGRRPRSNRQYWNRKLDGNKARDRRRAAEYRRIGWRRLIVWECQLTHPDRTLARLVTTLTDRTDHA